jgi:hypothetical protein
MRTKRRSLLPFSTRVVRKLGRKQYLSLLLRHLPDRRLTPAKKRETKSLALGDRQ